MMMNGGAQVIAESTSITSEPDKSYISVSDTTRLKATKYLEFNVKRPEDKWHVDVTGVLCVSNKVVVVDDNNNMMKLFDQNGIFLSSTEVKDRTWGITCVSDSAFATCGHGNTVYLWNVRGQTIVSEDIAYPVDHLAYGIHFNDTCYCLLHRHDNAITILDSQGRQVRKITLEEEACGRKFEVGYDIHMDSDTDNIYVPCIREGGVLCMTIEGKVLWYTPLTFAQGITEIHGTLCVADDDSICLMTKDGEYVKKLLDKDDLGGKPDYIYYGHDGNLYISYGSGDSKHDIISVYSVLK